ncbi:hypothetical protein CsSME_00048782 [Camellia sinensis var. sinensis]
MAAKIAIGYKFIPTDKELVLHYLRAKAKGQPLPVEGLVNECNLYDDQELSKIFSKMRTRSKLYYYFTELKKKNGKGKRIDRMVGKGTWKGLDRGKPIHDNEGRLTGRKRSFDYINRESSEHSVWDMKEYSLEGVSLEDDQLIKDKNYVLCAIKMKRRRAEIEQQEQPVDDFDIDHYSVEDDQPTPIIQQEEQPTATVIQQEEQPTAAVIQQELAPPDDDDHFDWDQFVWDSTLAATTVIQQEEQPTVAFMQQEQAQADDNGHFDWDQFVWDSTLAATPVIQQEEQPTAAVIQQEQAQADDGGHFDWDQFVWDSTLAATPVIQQLDVADDDLFDLDQFDWNSTLPSL